MIMSRGRGDGSHRRKKIARRSRTDKEPAGKRTIGGSTNAGGRGDWQDPVMANWPAQLVKVAEMPLVHEV
jgi:hypothetical protein